jgi:hypothetical protein
MKIILYFVLSVSTLHSFGQDTLCNREREQLFVDSIFMLHIESLKSTMNIKDIYLYTEKPISTKDRDFLEMFYCLSGIFIGEKYYGYATEPMYIAFGDVKIIETWYKKNRKKITHNNVNKILSLLKKVKTVQASSIDDSNAEMNSIYNKLDSLRIK